MAVYALWNNKGGVGKSYLTFQIACEYARTHHSTQKVLVIDLCPQANASGMLLGGIAKGEENLTLIASTSPQTSQPVHQSKSGVCVYNTRALLQ